MQPARPARCVHERAARLGRPAPSRAVDRRRRARTRSRSRPRVRAGPRRVLLALAARRESLARLRARAALRADDHGRRRRRLHRPRARGDRAGADGGRRAAWPRSRSTSTTSRTTRQPRFAIDGRRRVALDRRRGARRATPPSAPRCASSRGGSVCRRMKLATFRAPGGDAPRRRGPRRRRSSPSTTARPSSTASPPATARPATGAEHRARPTSTLLAPHVAAGDLRHRPELPRARRRDRAREPPEAPIVFMKLPELGRAARRPGRAARRSSGAWTTRASSAVVMGAGGAVAGLRRGRRRQRARPAAPRAAVDAREGLRRLLPVRPVGHDGRRGPRARGPARCARGSTASCARTRARATSSSRSTSSSPSSRETITLRARRPDPHRHAERRRHGPRPAAVPRAGGDVVRIEIEGLGAIEHRVA